MKKIVVTGGNGQLGKSLKDILNKRSDLNVSFIDIDELDITNPDAVAHYFNYHDCDIMVNCAAYTAVDKAETEPALAYKLNAEAVGYLAEAADSHNFKLIHISTDYVFDGLSSIPYSEADKPNPKTVYGRSKLRGEEILTSILPDAIILRTAWLYSEYGKNFFLTMKDKALSESAVRVVNDQTGSPTYAGDLALAITEILDSAHLTPGIYHFTNEGTTTWFEFTRAIYKILGRDPDLVSPISSVEFKSLATRPAFSVLDKKKIKDTFKIEIPSWEESLHKMAFQLKDR